MFTMVWLNKKGEIKKQLGSCSSAMLQLWIMQNVNSGYAVILNEQMEIVKVFESKNKNMAMPINIEDFPFDISVA